MSSIVSIATPVADLAQAARVVGVEAELGGQVEGHRESGRPLLEQVAVALVGFLGAGVSRVLTHRPELLAVHVAVHAAGERVLARVAEPLRQLRRKVVLRIEGGHLDA
jgi:hypothetical protein